MHKVTQQESGWPYSALLIIILLGTLVLGLVFGPDNRVVLSLFEYIQLPVEATLMALLAVSLAVAGVRMVARRARCLQSDLHRHGAARADGHGALAVWRRRADGDFGWLRNWLAQVWAGGRRAASSWASRWAPSPPGCASCSAPTAPTGTEPWRTCAARCAASPIPTGRRNVDFCGARLKPVRAAVRRRRHRPTAAADAGLAVPAARAGGRPPAPDRRRLNRPTEGDWLARLRATDPHWSQSEWEGSAAALPPTGLPEEKEPAARPAGRPGESPDWLSRLREAPS